MTVYEDDFGLKSPTYKTVSASGVIKSGMGRLRGIWVTSSKGGSLEFLDNTEDAIPVLIREFSTDALGLIKHYNFGDVAFGTGLYVVVKGAVTFTAIYF